MNLELLNEAIKDSGLKKSAIAQRMGFTKGRLYQKLYGKAQWRVDEAKKIGEVLGLSTKQLRDIFLS